MERAAFMMYHVFFHLAMVSYKTNILGIRNTFVNFQNATFINLRCLSTSYLLTKAVVQ